MARERIVILGAAGRDFHNFNVLYRNNPRVEVVAFTATQIPHIEGRLYPAVLAGEAYPAGIPIVPEAELPALFEREEIDSAVFSYSDASYEHVMQRAALVNALDADFVLLGAGRAMLPSVKPVIAVCAVRTGSGKSQTSRRVIELLLAKGLKVVAIRHPMPYGNLVAQRVQRFAELADLAKHKCTVEEMEEYEPHVVRGNVIYAGVDYAAILKEAENDPKGCDVILWDGGNNDFAFYKPDLQITVVDPHRPGHERTYYPGEISLRLADVVVINKMDSADAAGILKVRESIAAVNPKATVVDAASTLDVDDPSVIKGKRVLAIEDGPTLTHGEMKIGAAVVAAQKFGAVGFVDPRPFAVGRLAETFKIYPDIGVLLPAMGYGEQQLKDMETTINRTDCDSVVIGTPIDLGRIIKIKKPHTRVYYNLQEIGRPNLTMVLDEFIQKHRLA
jgi:predicted GTPase